MELAQLAAKNNPKVSEMNALDFLKQNAGNILIIVIAVAAFYYAFSLFQENQPEKENLVNGVRVLARGGVKNSFAELLAPQVIGVQTALANFSDALPCKVPMQTEVIYGLVSSGKNVSLQLYYKQENECQQKRGDSVETVACQAPRVVVQNGACDCIRLERQKQLVLIEGSEQWLCSNAANAREIFRWALAKS